MCSYGLRSSSWFQSNTIQKISEGPGEANNVFSFYQNLCRSVFTCSLVSASHPDSRTIFGPKFKFTNMLDNLFIYPFIYSVNIY